MNKIIIIDIHCLLERVSKIESNRPNRCIVSKAESSSPPVIEVCCFARIGNQIEMIRAYNAHALPDVSAIEKYDRAEIILGQIWYGKSELEVCEKLIVAAERIADFINGTE